MADNNTPVAPSNLPQVPPEFQGKEGKVNGKQDKKTIKQKVANFLASDKLDTIGSYLCNYVLKPGIIGLVWQLGSQALSMSLFGGNNVQNPNVGGMYVPGMGYQPGRRDPVPYQNYAWQAQQPGYSAYNYGYAQPQPGLVPQGPNQYLNLTDISFDTRDDAWLVLDRMGNELRRYGKVRVADFYNAAGITGQEGNWTLQGKGWTNLASAQPRMRTDGRWIIDFPQVQML